MRPAEAILRRGRIYLLDDQERAVESLALSHGRVIAAGDDAEVAGAVGPSAELVDLAGRTVLPGLIDAHLHLERYVLNLEAVDAETATLEACLARVDHRAAAAAPGEWVLGHGWNQNTWGRYGTRADIDAVSHGHPVYLTAKSLHAGWANSQALAVARLKDETPDPPDGALQRDRDGRLSGIVLEGAMSLVAACIPVPTPDRLAGALAAAQPTLWRLGLTGVHDFDGARCFQALQIAHARGDLGLRVVKNLPVDSLNAALEIGLRTGFGDEWLRIGHIKAFADGALGPRTAAMLAPYAGEPGNLGLSLLDAEALFEIAARAAQGGLALAVHAIGDRANHEVLNAFAQLRRREAESGWPELRHRIEHLQLLHPQDLDRPARLGLIASMQPLHATSDMEMAERYWGERSQTGYAWRSQRHFGAVLAFGSDAPVESPNPFWGLHAAVTRRRRDGSPGTDGWIPEERLPLREALRGYTYGAAYAAGLERTQGTLIPGSYADLIVLERDPFACGPEELADLLPVGTMVGGVWRQRMF